MRPGRCCATAIPGRHRAWRNTRAGFMTRASACCCRTHAATAKARAGISGWAGPSGGTLPHGCSVLPQRTARRISCSWVCPWGAATVMMTAGEPLPPNVRAIVEDCGYTTAWEEFRYQLKKPMACRRFPVLYTADALLRRRAGFSLREASAAAQVAHSRTPMLFIHGGKDAFVPFAMLDEVYAAARCPKEKICGAGCRPCGVPCAWRPRAIGQRCSIHRPLDAAARRGADSGCGPGGKAGIRRRIHKRKSSGEQAASACSPLLLFIQLEHKKESISGA